MLKLIFFKRYMTCFMSKPKVLICGSGIAGVATAYYLVKSGYAADIILLDRQQPLSLTTSKSGENFRDYWPQKCMRDFSTHSIELMKALREEHGEGAFTMNFSGYDFISCKSGDPVFAADSNPQLEALTSHLTDAATIQKKYPHLSHEVKSVTSIKNAGNVDVYAMGSLLLQEANRCGVTSMTGEVVGIARDQACIRCRSTLRLRHYDGVRSRPALCRLRIRSNKFA